MFFFVFGFRYRGKGSGGVIGRSESSGIREGYGGRGEEVE